MEPVVDELTYVIGPALAVMLSTALFPQAPPAVAGVLLVVGVTGTALTTLPFLFVGNIATMAAVVLVAGLFFAPNVPEDGGLPFGAACRGTSSG